MKATLLAMLIVYPFWPEGAYLWAGAIVAIALACSAIDNTTKRVRHD